MEDRLRATMRVAQLALLGSLLATLACSTSQTSSQTETTATPQPDSDFREGPMVPEQRPPERVDMSSALQPIYFDYDKSAIRDDAKSVLRSNAEAISANGQWGRITIEGHCDERGSEEYNLALGERRAASVRRYMMDLGVSGSRMDTVSFGETKPAVMGHDESAWRYNRRSEFTGSR